MTILTSPPVLGTPALDDRRWATVSQSRADDARLAVESAVAGLALTEMPALLLVFVACSLDPDAVAAALSDAVPGVPVVGCTTRGEISEHGMADDSVVIMALGGPGVSVATAAEPIIDGDARAAARAAARCARSVAGGESTVLITLADGNGIDQDDIVRGAYDLLGPVVPVVGGCAGGEVQQVDARLFWSDGSATSQSTGMIVMAAVASDAPIGIGVGHGWQPMGEPRVVTSASPTVVSTLDEQPALDVYLASHGCGEDLLDDPDAFERFALARPLGVARRGRVEPRCVIGADRVARTLVTAAPVPQGGVVWLMEGDSDSVLDAVDTAVGASLAPLAGARPTAAVVFDCGARRSVLGDEGSRAEVDRLAEGLDCPMSGLYTFGEIARAAGRTGFLNQTIVVVTFA
ncbi:MAG: FIST N-terminal domain-containing protein [Acidimicrobiales bacterium]